jgi:hypothetical protein
LRAGERHVGYAELCHEVVKGTSSTRQETIRGRWHLNGDGEHVETITDGNYIDLRNGPSLGAFDGAVVGGTGHYAGSAGDLKGHGTFGWQPTSNAWFKLHFTMHLD